MRIAVTGSSGLIGSALVAHLDQQGHEVLRVVRSVTPGPNLVRWAPGDGTIDAAALEGVDAVVHLAGAGIGDRRWTADRKRTILESRTRSTELLARTIAEMPRPPAVLISASAIGIYGDRQDDLLTEESDVGTGFLADVCRAWETAADPARDAGVRVVHPRTGIVLTPSGGALAKLLPFFRVGLGGRMGSGRQVWSWISLADELRALAFLLDNDLAGPVNLTGPTPATNSEISAALGAVLHRPTVLPVPAFGPRLLMGRELANELLFTSAHVVPKRLLDAGFSFTHTTVHAALEDVLT